MSASERFEVLRDTDHGQEHRVNPHVDTVLQELFASEQSPSRNPVGLCDPDGGACETFVGGAGI